MAPTAIAAPATPPESTLRPWFFALPILVVALWWPLSPFWASDDFFALHYAQDASRALADFAGPQYGAEDIWSFYRPLITLSFWFDALVAGADPFWAHLGNVLAHAASALLVALLWRRLLPDGLAFGAGLAWAIAPGHVGTVAWAVGRVDGYTAVPMLLATLLFVRSLEGRPRAALWSLLAFAVALCCKELAMALPGVLGLIAFAHARGGVGARIAGAVRRVAPFALLLAGYVAFRFAVLGRFGGYTGGAIDALAAVRGFGAITLALVDPLLWIDPQQTERLGDAARWLPVVGALPAIAGVAVVLSRRRLDVLLLCLLLYVVLAIPMVGFFAGADSPHNLRYFYVPFAALAGLLCCSVPGLLVTLVVFGVAFVSIRHEQWQADRQSAAMHQQLVSQQDEGLPGPWFVAGLPHTNARGTAMQFHFGIDRLLQPPFGEGHVRVFAHRPILSVPGALRLEDDVDMPIAPPLGTTLLLRGGDLLTTIPPHAVPELPLAVDGALEATPGRLQQWKDDAARPPGERQGHWLRFATPGVRPQCYRVTIFTATGYLCTIVPDHAPEGAEAGFVDLYTLLASARWALAGEHFVVRALEVPTILDLDPSFPVLIEAGRIAGTTFVVTHRARSMPELRFDRGFPAWVRRANGEERS